ncbi:MAG: TetR/AcrR family transcriptional regulator [Candidatus Velthaea sp.]
MQTPVRPGSPAEETRARILAAAKEIYEQNGTRGTTTREVAERAGVNEATLFRHFGNKHSLLVAMRENSCGIEVLNNVIASLGGEVRGDLITIAESMIARMNDQRAMMCISLAEAARGEVDRSSPEWRGPRQIMDRLTEYFSVHVRSGTLKGEPEHMARFFMGIFFSYVVADKIWDSREPRRSDITSIVDTFLNGVQ